MMEGGAVSATAGAQIPKPEGAPNVHNWARADEYGRSSPHQSMSDSSPVSVSFHMFTCARLPASSPARARARSGRISPLYLWIRLRF